MPRKPTWLGGRLGLAAVAVGWLLGAAGCGGAGAGPGADPAALLRRYLTRVQRGDLSGAYGLLSSSFRATCDLPCFKRRVAAEPGAAAAVLSQLRSGDYRVERSAAIGSLAGLRLVGPPGGAGDMPWLLSGDPLDFYPQDTPGAALRSFLLALERRRYDQVLRFVPPKLRGEVTETVLRQRWDGPERATLLLQVQAVRRHLHEPLIIDSGEARLPLGDRREARLLQEDGRWYVVQLQ